MLNEEYASDERDRLHRYRAALREWLHGQAATYTEPTAVTFTLADQEVGGSIISNHDPNYAAASAARAIKASGMAGIVVVESGRRGGRIHAHAVVSGSGSIQYPLGFTVVKPTIDLLGWIVYMTKAAGPESVIYHISEEGKVRGLNT